MKLEGKKILITGGAGFIGSHICERLLQENADIVILDNFSTGKLSNIEHVKNHIRIIEGNAENYSDASEAMKGCDIVVHEAFPYGKSGMGLKEQYIEAGVLGTFNILRAAVENSCEKVLYASTVAVYGIPEYLPIDEKHPIRPFLPYGATKYAGELYCSTFSKLYGLTTISLRYFYVYGPRYAQFDHSAMVNFLHCALGKEPLLIYGDGYQTRDYTYIEDAVEGSLLALRKEGTQGEAYNISTGKGITILELANKVVATTEQNVQINFAQADEYNYSDEYCTIPIGLTSRREGKWIDERNYVGDISQARKDLGYNPTINLEEGIRKTFEWLQGLKRG
jgi:UDP-glucose 4-epimerase